MSDHMAKMLRLTKEEEKTLNKKCIEINKILIMSGGKPVKDSELIHLILNDALKRTKINKRNEVEVI